MSRAVVPLHALAMAVALAACGDPIEDVPAVEAAPAVVSAPVAVPPPFRFEPPASIPDGARKGDEAPFSLTSSDGEGLALAAVQVRGVVMDPLAFTELALTFRNDENRVREGRFQITLPDGATLSRFAMKIGDRWQEGEVVEKQAARRAYEDFLHRRQDPALLESAAGNQFEARVFPIPARSVKELIISYSHELPSSTGRYRVALQGLPEIGALDVRVRVGAGAQARVVQDHHEGYVPDRDVDLEVPREAGRVGVRSDELVVARVAPFTEAAPAAIASLLVLVDTSASRALGFDEEVRLVDSLLRGLGAGAGKDAPITVAAFDQTVDVLYEGAASGWSEGPRAALRSRRALGASDLGAALAFAATRGRERVLLITDGIATAGEVDTDLLLTAAHRLGDARVQRLDAVSIGGIRDVAVLKKLTTALPQAGVVVDAGDGAAAIAARLTRAVRARIPIVVEGASWWWPTVVDGAQPGDEVLVYADLPAGAPLRITAGGAHAVQDGAVLGTVERPLIERAAAKARIDALIAERDDAAGGDAAAREVLRERIVDLSTKSRVLSPFTALLVLETERDYARFGIDRRALVDVLTVGDSGLVVLHRDGADVPTTRTETRRKPPPPRKASPPAPVAAEGEREAMGAKEGEREAPAEEDKGEAEGGDERAKKDVTAERAADRDGDSVDSKRSESAAPRRSRDDDERPASKVVSEDEGHGAGRIDDAIGGLRGASGSAPGPGLGMSGGGAGGGGVEAQQRVARIEPAPMPRLRPTTSSSTPSPGSTPASESPPMPLQDPTTASESSSSRAGPRTTEAPPPSPPRAEPMDSPERDAVAPRTRQTPTRIRGKSAWTGPFAEVMRHLKRSKVDEAVARATAWHEESPGDVLALVALGDALAAKGDVATAARAYGSIIDLFPARADLRRYAGGLLEALDFGPAHALALDAHEKAAADRADHPASHHALGMSLVRAARYADAFAALEKGIATRYPSDRFLGGVQILREDLGLVGAAWEKAEPQRKDEIRARLKKSRASFEGSSSVRFVLTWETDGNDVDFHIRDRNGEEAYYAEPELSSGGRLYADVTTGYGPECFTVRGKGRAYPYTLEAHYYSRGPMGYGMGRLQVIEHDGKGGLTFADRPFVVMQDDAFVDLGKVKGRLAVN